ncbi:MAG: TetR/AcrR family transcriptional regulator [Desulfomonilia bacterium]
MKRKKGRHAGTESRRRDIIHAALECFSTIGITQTSMSDIRTRSLASTGSIYHHFKSKDMLASEVYLEGIREYQAGILSSLEQEPGAREGITAMISFHMKWVEENRVWSRYLFQYRHASFMAASEEHIERLNRDFVRRVSAWFDSHVLQGVFRVLPPDIYVSLILGPCMEYARQYLSGQTLTGIDQAIAVISDAIWRSLCKNSKPISENRAHSRGG